MRINHSVLQARQRTSYLLRLTIWKQNIPRVSPYGAAFELDTVSIQDGELLLTIMSVYVKKFIIRAGDSETVRLNFLHLDISNSKESRSQQYICRAKWVSIWEWTASLTLPFVWCSNGNYKQCKCKCHQRRDRRSADRRQLCEALGFCGGASGKE